MLKAVTSEGTTSKCSKESVEQWEGGKVYVKEKGIEDSHSIELGKASSLSTFV